MVNGDISIVTVKNDAAGWQTQMVNPPSPNNGGLTETLIELVALFL